MILYTTKLIFDIYIYIYTHRRRPELGYSGMCCFRTCGFKIRFPPPSPISASGVKSPRLQLMRVNQLSFSSPTSSNTASLNSRTGPGAVRLCPRRLLRGCARSRVARCALRSVHEPLARRGFCFNAGLVLRRRFASQQLTN